MTHIRLTLAAVAALTLAAFGCWFTDDNFNGNYIAGVNNYTAHYIEGDASRTQAQYVNGGYAALPITPLVKINPRVADQAQDASRDLSIKCAIFRYRVFSSGGVAKGDWTPVKFFLVSAGARPGWDENAVANLRASLPEPYKSQLTPTAIVWNMEYATPVTLFGRNCIAPVEGKGLYTGQSLAAGDVIIMQYYLNDGLFETGDLSEDITPSKVGGLEGTGLTSSGRSGFPPPFIFKVIFNGKRRIGR